MLVDETGTMADIRTSIHARIAEILREKALPLPALGMQDYLRLSADLGLGSIDLARLVTSLELQLGIDPFAKLVSITSVRTIGDLYAAYARCLNEDLEEARTEEPVTEQGVARGELRRSMVAGMSRRSEE